jgi:hypothetical protein
MLFVELSHTGHNVPSYTQQTMRHITIGHSANMADLKRFENLYLSFHVRFKEGVNHNG